MSLTSGTRLGPYEIISQIGAGGMGEVYKATDTRLNRTIAIKVLPEHLADDPQRLARFRREAQTISSLNHPHICALHDVGDENGTHFLVMEFVEGEALDQVLSRGPVPLDDALEYAKQIADALEKAHHQGIVHRDLKPANVMITKSGVKLLDFGLAKLTVDAGSGSPLSQMKTQDSDLTAEGTIMGTFRYMAPEQVEGQDVDSRTDIYALCLVIYEMITGKRAIDGKTQASLIAAILKDKPQPLTELKPITPPQLDRVVQTGLEKEPDTRWQSAREVKHALEWIGLETKANAPAIGAKLPVMWTVAMVVLAVVSAITLALVFRPESAPPEARLHIPMPSTAGGASISPDGRNLILADITEGISNLWIRPLGSFESRMLPGTEGASSPFWKPDSSAVGFFADRQLKRIDMETERVEELTPVPVPQGGSWSTDGTILFVPGPSSGLFRIAEDGGEPELVEMPLSEARWWFPQFLPDGNHFLIWNPGTIWLAHLDESQEPRLLLDDIELATYALSGHLLFVQDGRLYAQAFDPEETERRGNDILIADGVSSRSISVSDDGTILYHPITDAVRNELVRVDREGNVVSMRSIPADRSFALSPDASRVTTGRLGFMSLHDLDGERTPETFPGGYKTLFSPDGTQIAYLSRLDDGSFGIRVRTLGSNADPPLLVPDSGLSAPMEWTENFLIATAGVDNAPWAVPWENTAERFPITPDLAVWEVDLSPDERWIAYRADLAGQFEVYVRRLSDSDGSGVRVSTNGGAQPRWGPAGSNQLFYIALNGDLMVTEVDFPDSEDGDFVHSDPMPLFPSGMSTVIQNFNQQYDVFPNGREFLISRPPADAEGAPLNLILNWNPDAE